MIFDDFEFIWIPYLIDNGKTSKITKIVEFSVILWIFFIYVSRFFFEKSQGWRKENQSLLWEVSLDHDLKIFYLLLQYQNVFLDSLDKTSGRAAENFQTVSMVLPIFTSDFVVWINSDAIPHM